MKLPKCLETSDARTQVEMLVWLTPVGNSHEVSDKFLETAALLQQGVALLSQAYLGDDALGIPERLATQLMAMDPDERGQAFGELVTCCFLLCGTSDNAIKCQFPVLLQSSGQVAAQRLIRFSPSTRESPTLSTISSDSVMKAVVKPRADVEAQRELLVSYLGCILDRGDKIRVGRVAAAMGALDTQSSQALAEVLALAVIKGSATASGGHEPEEALRRIMGEWGLVRDIDFNSTDVNARQVYELFGVQDAAALAQASSGKSRAFDFVLPYRVPGRIPAIFIQAQFYAGDSGSVSHKNVDQTPTGRQKVLSQSATALFAELLDGAGYVTALSGDAKKLLGMETTSGIVQLRTARVRLRELLQRAGFLTPLEVAHAIWKDGPDRAEAQTGLAADYSVEEATRAWQAAVDLNWVHENAGRWQVADQVADPALRYAFHDSVALAAEATPEPKLMEGLVVPGYGIENQGVSYAAVVKTFRDMVPHAPKSLVTDSAIESLCAQLLADDWVRWTSSSVVVTSQP